MRSRRIIALAIGASAACAAAASLIHLRKEKTSPLLVASVIRVDGELRLASNGATHQVIAGETLVSGEALQTGPGTHAALSFGRGMSLRLDADSKLRLLSNQAVALDEGALYIDWGAEGSPAADLRVRTIAGTVRHVGTQYQIRTIRPAHGDSTISGIEVSIREGHVQIDNANGTSTGSAGERLSISARGTVLRSHLTPRDPSWNWAVRAAPPFDIAGQSLSSFLGWVARETGRKLVYADAAARNAAQGLKLGGSIEGLSADTALAAVLSTTKLRRIQANDESIDIALGTD